MPYNILNDYDNSGSNVSDISVHYYWAIAVYSLKYPATFKRSADASGGASFDNNILKGVQVKSKPLFIVDDCQSISVQHSKSNHVGNLSAVLYPNKEYLSLINPGDYIFCWMVNSEQDVLNVFDNVKNSRPANSFSSGLKFYGRVNAVREQIIQSPDGPRQGRFVLNAHSFTELDATFFYEQHLARRPEGLAEQWREFGFDLDKVLDLQDGQRGIVPNQFITNLIDVFLGKGVNQNLDSGAATLAERSTFGTAGDFAHVVPNSVGDIFGKTVKSGKHLRTADVVEVVHGIQKYSNRTNVNDISKISKTFNPNNTLVSESRRFTGVDLLGRNTATPPSLINQSLWSVARQYLNPACNEMYATLRVNPDGDIAPTVVVRQLPFTTDAYQGSLQTTSFSELPRWELPSIIVRSTDIGRSDAMRINFIHVYGTSDTVNSRNVTQQMVDAPPRFDEMDIARSGLRPYMTTVPCWVDETRENNGPKKWMDLITDFMMGQHMTLTGTIVTSGIQSPICVGDNLEWDNVLYHIEAVTHSCSISADGRKNFTTTLNITNGMAIDSLASIGTTDLGLYARIDPAIEQSAYMPNTNTESTLENIQKTQSPDSVNRFDTIPESQE